ncbi:hypothetical protein HIM_10136 [Hirsutella minnesotensis 3608]|uniref:Protein kinase domain-containing protein n=1 Tax=Hirsutella minnesotensis 3608 TaxID=1043627 RepID=A0A0F8A2K4_9HYPO|nr:hypothetical protein HIM_10136 [Hirsutella minnesotensis 3608]
MAGLGWTFKDLIEWLEQIPDSPNPPNSAIEQLLRTCPGSYIFGIGGHSAVLWVSPHIAAKVSLQPGDERLRNEQSILKLLDQSDQSRAFVIQHFFIGSDITFLELLDHGTLHDRMRVEGPRPILQWMLQLSSAAACLEALGYAHGDINPQNILFDSFDQVKLIDFDHTLKAGEALDVGYEPYVRQSREVTLGLFGTAGPITEQFALGAVFWYMTRGSELYSELDGPDRLDRLLDGNFPAMDPQDPVDKIIGKCFQGSYVRVADLVQDIRDAGAKFTKKQTVSSRQRSKRTRLCERYYSQLMPGVEDGNVCLGR